MPYIALLFASAAVLILAVHSGSNSRSDDCFHDLVVKQQTGQVGRYGIVDGFGVNMPLTHDVLQSICQNAWDPQGPTPVPTAFACPNGYGDPECAPRTALAQR